MGNLTTLQCRLLVAIQNNDVAEAEFVLKQGLDADVRFIVGSQSRPAICLCVERGHLEITQLFLLYGCSVNQCDAAGYTPLHIAAAHRHVHLVSLLIANRANIKAVTDSGQTPLHVAAQQESLEIVQCLVDAGSDLERKDQDGCTPLAVACMFGNTAIVEFLVQKGANINTQDYLDGTPLLHALSGQHMDLRLISTLLAAGAKVDGRNKRGETPLLAAVRGAKHMHATKTEDNMDIVGILIDYGCDLNAPSFLGQSPMHLAVVQHLDSYVEYLIRAGCDLNTQDALGLTPLFHLTKNGKRKLVALMVMAGVDLNRQEWMTEDYLLDEIWDKPLLSWLLSKKYKVSTLKHSCRAVLRTAWGKHTGFIISSLPLPRPLLRYLDLQDM